MSSEEKFDCIVVGAGPAGISAAITMARAGLSVAVIERGEYPGAKNMSGGILFSTAIGKLLGHFPDNAPVERRIIRRRFSLMTGDTELAFEFRTARWDAPPHNHSWTVLRAKFDQWFGGKAEEAGAELVCGVLVKELIIRDGRVVGVKTEPGGDELYADCVINAEGANSLLTLQAGLRDKFNPHSTALGVKEVISLDRGKIEERFNLEGNEGAGFQFFGQCVKGLYGSAFLYTNLDSVSAGLALSVGHLTEASARPHELLDSFASHPALRPYLRGGETVEYSAHMIPEAGYFGLPRDFVTDGLLLAGDAAGFINTSQYFEGTNLASASGIMAGETVIEAKKKGDFSKAALSEYTRKLKDSFILKDIHKFRRMKKTMLAHPEYLSDYPDAIAEAVIGLFTISDKSKAEVEREVRRHLKSRIGRLGLLKAAWNMRKAMGSPLF
jgi:electron transfer flavoprotein-quinone oxidoreductase